ncbi:sodium-dependent transporter [Halalkalibacter krulwichiae]|uniref:Sodium:neurotransmitter symporter family protein n=1 Tax=Halalkalibacter krulwichiae TaxID=199441 RepID=A0A1X9M9W7_9BACI|nr:sodium-dependent transporter [Halalkalibacter krulwichiae]ARK30196.1 Sodium:neurotransmitter symporter family protein [Halalkalibacter krulwichiae]
MSVHEQWKSKLGFILAAAGSAIGLGAIWKLPYVAGTSGGGAFFLMFILFTILLGFPLLLGEFIIGRRAQSDAISTYKKLAPKTKWHWTGRLGVFTSFLVLTFYSVVGGWIILYLFQALTGGLNGLSQEEYGQLFGNIISNPIEALIGQIAFLLITVLVVSKGIQQGIEKATSFMMPALFVLFLLLVARSLTLEGAMDGIRFLLVPDFSQLNSEVVLFALGQAFFALSLGVSVMVTYSSYLPKDQNLPKSALSIVGMNLFIALLAGLAIFPGVFTFGLEVSEGPTLVFAVLPAVFNEMPFGILFFIAFLILFLFAALTSAFSMVESLVACIAKDDQTKRKKYTWISGAIIFIVGIPSCLSYGLMADFELFGRTFFDFVDMTVSNIMMPLGALAVSLFVTFKVSRADLIDELQHGSKVGKIFFNVWFYLLRYVTPLAIIIVFLDVLGVGVFDWF